MDSLREVIAFPKTARAQCLMTQAPGGVDSKQLRELNIKVDFIIGGSVLGIGGWLCSSLIPNPSLTMLRTYSRQLAVLVLLWHCSTPSLSPAAETCSTIRTSYNPTAALRSDAFTLTPGDPRWSAFLVWAKAKKLYTFQIIGLSQKKATHPVSSSAGPQTRSGKRMSSSLLGKPWDIWLPSAAGGTLTFQSFFPLARHIRR